MYFEYVHQFPRFPFHRLNFHHSLLLNTPFSQDSSHHLWRCGVVVITTTQFHSTKPELRFCAGSNLGHGVSEIRDGEDL